MDLLMLLFTVPMLSNLLVSFVEHPYADSKPQLPYAPLEIEYVVENGRCQIYWNYSFCTTRLLSSNKSDIVLKDRESQIIYVIEFSCPAETNVTKKNREKRDKYRYFVFDIGLQHPGYRVKLVVLIVGCLGGIKANFLGELNIIPACKRNSKTLACRMQKEVVLGNLRVLRAHKAD